MSIKINLLFVLVIFQIQLIAQNIDPVLEQLYNQHKYQQVISFADSTIKINSNDFQLWYYKGMAEQALYKYSQSVKSLENAVALAKNKQDLFFTLGNAYDLAGNPIKAIETYKKLVDADTLNIPALAKLAKLYKSEKEYLTAIDLFSKLVKIDSTNSYFYSELAYCCNKLGLNQPALNYYERAIQLNPNDIESCRYLVSELIDQKYYTDATKMVDSFLIRFPDNIQLLKQRAYILALGGSYLDAVRAFQKVIEMGDSSAFTSKYYGQSLFNNGQYAESVYWLERYLSVSPDDSRNQFILGLACQNDYQYEKSLKHFAISLNQIYDIPLIARLYTETGNTYAKYGDYLGFRDSTGTKAPVMYKLAIENYLKAEEINSNDFEIYKILGEFYENKMKDRKLALYYFEKYYKELDPKKIEEYQLIWIQNKLTKIKEEMHFRGE